MGTDIQDRQWSVSALLSPSHSLSLSRLFAHSWPYLCFGEIQIKRQIESLTDRQVSGGLELILECDQLFVGKRGASASRFARLIVQFLLLTGAAGGDTSGQAIGGSSDGQLTAACTVTH